MTIQILFTIDIPLAFNIPSITSVVCVLSQSNAQNDRGNYDSRYFGFELEMSCFNFGPLSQHCRNAAYSAHSSKYPNSSSSHWDCSGLPFSFSSSVQAYDLASMIPEKPRALYSPRRASTSSLTCVYLLAVVKAICHATGKHENVW